MTPFAVVSLPQPFQGIRFHGPAAFHHEHDFADGGDVLDRIALHRDQIRLESRRDGADLIAQAERRRGHGSAADDRVHGIVAPVLHAIDEFLEIAPMRARHRIGAEHDFHPMRPRALQNVGHHRQSLFHVGEPFFVVVADAHVFRLVVDVVVQHQKIRVEEYAALPHQVERCVIEHRPMLNAGAAGQNRRARAVGRVRVHHRAETLCAGLAASGIDLLRGHGLLASVADAGRGEDLNHVRAVALRLADDLADFVRIAGSLVDLPQRSENTRTLPFASMDGIAEGPVDRGAQALDGGESGQQRDAGVFGGVAQLLFLRLAAGEIAAVFIEMPTGMRVRVDPARHQRHALQVEVRFGAAASRYFNDLRAFDSHCGVAHHAALAVEHAVGVNDDGLRRAGNRGRHKKEGFHGNYHSWLGFPWPMPP